MAEKRTLRLLYRNDDWMYALYEEDGTGELILHSLCGENAAHYDVFLQLAPEDRRYYLDHPYALNYLAASVCSTDKKFAHQLIDIDVGVTRFVE
ncbi:MAG: hypothetical protein ACFB21_12130 [Opitutales bacterium]